MPVPFGGLGVALISVFGDRGELDAEATAGHAVRLAELGVRFVLVCGSTGEAGSLTPEERVQLIGAVRSALPAAVPVVAGTGAAATAAAAALTVQARAAGADAILALSPPGSQGLVGYYTGVVDAAGALPVLAYHFPAVSPPGIPTEILQQLPVAGLKDSSGDAGRLTDELTTWGGSVFVGATSMIELARSLGGAGAILAIANAEPERCLAALDGDVSAQRALAALSAEARRDFPSGIKGLTAARFGTSTVVRRAVRSTA